jgi:hypothetical protein
MPRKRHPQLVLVRQQGVPTHDGHWFAEQTHCPLWQESWFEQLPQFRVLPQLSLALPQDMLWDEHDFGAQQEPL